MACFALCAAACAITGCLPSDTITDTVYDTKEDSLELADTQKILHNDINAEQTTDVLPELTTNEKSKSKDKTDQDLPKYGGDTSDALVAQRVYKSGASDKGEAKSSEKQQEETESEEKSASEVDKKSKKKSASKSKKGKGTKNKKKNGKNNKAQGKKKTDSGKGRKTSNEVKVYEDYGDSPEIPEKIDKVTAVGQAAVIVSMLGGTEDSTPLVAADTELLSNEKTKKVLASKGIDKVKKFWKKDGASKDLKSVDKIIDSDADLCFVLEEDETFTSKQEDKLLENNILVYVLPKLSSARKIEYAVKLVGKILEKGGNEQAGELADSYKEWHDGLVDKFTDKNGGITGGFNYNTGKKVSTNADTLYSLLITDWDADARYNDENSGYLSSTSGVGIADLSYKETPACYYMSVGGVVNNAAAASWKSTSLSGQTAAVWQFSQTTCPSAFKYWNSIDKDKVTYAPDGGNGLDNSLLWNPTNKVGLGEEQYPGVVVSTQKMKTDMEADAERENGIYHPYPVSTTSGSAHVKGVGYADGNTLVRSSIGTSGEGATSVFYEGEETALNGMYDIYVNPEGSFSSWTAGSVESVLEASWIYKTFRDNDYDLKSDVEYMYSTFYDYDLSDEEYEAIIAGPEE